MRSLILSCCLLALLTSLGCAVSDYPVIFDTHGPWADTVLTGQYEQAFLIPEAQTAIEYPDGSDELFCTVAQDNMGDQWLYTYNNYDPSAAVRFLDQTYCDPTRQDGCAIITAWNPDLPTDEMFDYTFDETCPGARSYSILVAYGSRLAECGSGVMNDPQAAAYEFAELERSTYRGRPVYVLPFDHGVASFVLTAYDTGATTEMPLYGRYTTYLDEELRLIAPYAPNLEYQKRFLRRFADANGERVELEVTYGALRASFDLKLALR